MAAQNRFFSLPGWLKRIVADPFRRYLSLCLLVLGCLLLFLPLGQQRPVAETTTENTIHFFFHPNCPHCRAQKQFNQYLNSRYPQLTIVAHDTALVDGSKQLTAMTKQMGIAPNRISIPVTFIGPYVIVGFDDPGTTGLTIEKAITAYLADDPALFTQEDQQWLTEETVDLPWIGELQLSRFSLPTLAIIIGLADGFNPCAMWVLVYLISLIISIRDRKKIWFLVGSFVLASGVLYFLFMTAWLNVFLLIGYIRPLTVIIGLFAMGAGIMNIRNYLITRGSPACTIGNANSRQRTMGKIETVIQQPLSVATISGIVALAFIVNSIEFACSAALPAIYTHILSLRDLAPVSYYGYILLYVFFFMLDDLIIFSLAALAMNSDTGKRYAKHCTLLGGLVLLLLGLVMAFQPNLLR